MRFRYVRFMIRCLLIMGLPGVYFSVWAQTVSHAEYFFDQDPGFGSGTAISFTAGQPVEINAEIDVTGLVAGVHTLFVRTRDSNGKWSLMEGRTFLIQEMPTTSTPTLAAAEYFFDQDPGFGSGTAISFTAGQPVEINAEIDVTGLVAGVHTLFVRTRDSNGKWSLMEGRTFLIQEMPTTSTPTLAAAEYFFDQDPGFGSGKSLSINEQGQAEVEIDLSKEGLTTGFHTLYVRAKDTKGKWSLHEGRQFMINQALTGLTQIIAAEYFFDTANPAPGQGIPLTITTGTTLDITPAIEIPSTLSIGKHQLTLRVKDSKGLWSEASVQEFTIDPNVLKVVTDSTSAITSSSATLHGTVNANGTTATAAFQYSTDLSYSSLATLTTPPVTGNTDTPVSVSVSGLEANTTYNFRVRVITAQDTLYGGNETFTTLLESVAPMATLEPANNAIDISIYSDLILAFNEPIQLGTGSIIIKQNDIAQPPISLTSDQVTLSEDNTILTINPSTDFEFSAAISVEITDGSIKDLAGNNYEATDWNFTTLPPITIEKGFTEIGSNASTAETAVKVNYPIAAISEVKILSKDITRNTWNEYKMTQDPQNLAKFALNLPLPATLKDEIGLEYYFELTTTSGQKVASDTQLVNTSYNDPGLPIPDLVFGSEKKDYQIISIPLTTTLKEASSILNELGNYERDKWRLFTFTDNKLVEYTNGFTTIDPGKAYLLIIKNEVSINTGEGSTLRHNAANPFTLQLKKGWNLIGNPYNLNLSWQDIKTASGIPETARIGKLLVFENGTYDVKGSDKLKAFGGGFVQWEEDTPVTLKFPVARNLTLNSGRIAAEESIPRHHPGSEFEVNFSLKTKELSYSLGGLGMHPEARQDRDYLDEVGLPRILHYLQVNFAHPEHFYGRFTKDMMPVEENKIWEFTVDSNLDTQEATLQWENYFTQSTAKQLFLYDSAAEKIIDMKGQQQYLFELSKERKFKVYYGDPAFMAENLKASRIQLLANFPNPFSEFTTVAFALPQAKQPYQVQVQIYDTGGKLVTTLANGKYQAGFYQLSWDGKSSQGQRLSAGMYIGRASISSASVNQSYTLKMILR